MISAPTRVGLRVRAATRSIRRIVDGGRGLSPVETFRWLVRRDRPIDKCRSSSYTAALADDHRTTRVMLHNYWTEAAGISGELPIELSLIGENGTVQGTRAESLPENATLTLDVRDWCRDEGIRLPFTGQLLIEAAHERMIARRPLQVIAEYLDDDGGASSVHGQFGRLDRPLAQTVGSMRLAPLAEGRTAVVAVNGYAKQASAALELVAWNRSGEHRRVALGRFASQSSRVVFVDDVITDLDRFLGGSSGHFAVRYPFPAARAYTFVERADGSRVGDHGTIERVTDTLSELPPTWAESRSVVSLPVVLGSGRDTVVGLANRWGARVVPRDVVVALHREDGTRICEYVTRIQPSGFHQLSMAEVVRICGVSGDVFHGELWIDDLESDGQPATFDALIGFAVDGHVRSEVQVGGAFFNANVPPGIGHPDVRRTRVFGTVTTDERSVVFLAHPVASDAPAGLAVAAVRLLAHDGRELAVTDLRIPPHGFVRATIPDLFPGFVSDQQEAVVKVRSTDARLFGYYSTESAGTPTFATCHLLGG